MVSNEGNPYYTVHFDAISEVMVRYQSLVDAGSYSLQNSRRVGFDVSNWLPTVWELIPYSFLVDYFVNIGEIVSAATLNSSSVLWTNKTVTHRVSYRALRWEANSKPYSNNVATVPGKAKSHLKTVTRYPNYAGAMVPTLTFSLPGLGQALNIAALGSMSKDVAKLVRT
jgi:hypothetical protein